MYIYIDVYMAVCHLSGAQKDEQGEQVFSRRCTYIYSTRSITAQVARGARKGPAHKGPGGPARAWPTSAQGDPQGPGPKWPRGAHKGLAHKGPMRAKRAHDPSIYIHGGVYFVSINDVPLKTCTSQSSEGPLGPGPLGPGPLGPRRAHDGLAH